MIGLIILIVKADDAFWRSSECLVYPLKLAHYYGISLIYRSGIAPRARLRCFAEIQELASSARAVSAFNLFHPRSGRVGAAPAAAVTYVKCKSI